MDPSLERVWTGLEALKNPAHTGENRCRPCTVFNVAIALGVSGVLAARRSFAVGSAAMLTCGAVIYLRGYLVPGTPAITQRFVPPWLLAQLGKEPRRQLPADLGSVVGSRRFRTAWRDRIDALRDTEITPRQVAATLGVPESDVSTVPGGVAFAVRGEELLHWESEAALVADVAAAEVLAARADRWSTLDHDERRRGLAELRRRLDRCPGCDGPLDRETDRLVSCCRDDQDVVSVTCRDCETTVLDRTLAD